MTLQNAIATITIAVTDVQRAKDFYGNTLGLKEVGRIVPEEAHKEIVYETRNGNYVCLYERPSPSGSSATACSFEVDDVDRTVKDLQESGVDFEDYDMPEMGIKTRNGVAQIGDFKSAWFKDPDGNILAVANGMKLLRDGRTPMAQRA